MRIHGQRVQSSLERLVHHKHLIYNCCWSDHYGLLFITRQSSVCVCVSATISGFKLSLDLTNKRLSSLRKSTISQMSEHQRIVSL